MTITTTPVHELLEGYTRRTVLDKAVLEKLVAVHDKAIDLLATGEISSINQFDLAPSEICEEADLPRGSTWAEVVAAILDIQSGTSGNLRDLAYSATAAGIELAATKEVW